jgi:hypothetical protein
MWKHSNVCSLPVLIGRAAWPPLLCQRPRSVASATDTDPNTLLVSHILLALTFSFRLGLWAEPNGFLVVMPEGLHPIPSRTRSLRPPGPMVLQGILCGRVGRRQEFFPKRPVAFTQRAFFFSPPPPSLDPFQSIGPNRQIIEMNRCFPIVKPEELMLGAVERAVRGAAGLR